jgi:hypothetical protein
MYIVYFNINTYFIINYIMTSIFKDINNFDQLPFFLDTLKSSSFENDYNPDILTHFMSKYKSDKGYGLCNDFKLYNGLPPNIVAHNYTFFYNLLFNNFREYKINIFEIDVSVPSCVGSLLGWKEYFINSKIFSADIDNNYLYNDEQITSYYVDQENKESIQQLWKNMENIKFDLIIDNGLDTYTSNYLFYVNSIQNLNTYGIYIIEDVHLFFIDTLYDNIIKFNNDNNIIFNIQKIVIPYPSKFTHPGKDTFMQMNNLIFIQIL